MALYIEFTRKNEDKPTELTQIDVEVCNLLGIEEDPDVFAYNWLSFIGQEACIEGYELGTQALRQKVISWDMPELITIQDYLVENFTARTWYR